MGLSHVFEQRRTAAPRGGGCVCERALRERRLARQRRVVQHHLGVAVELAGAGPRGAVPQEQRVAGERVGLVGALEPLVAARLR